MTLPLEEPDFDLSDESEDDVQQSGPLASSAVVTATDWTTETLLSQLRRGNIDLDPTFQRRDAWTLERKSRFIESLVLGIPVPQVVLAERKGTRGKYIVIDGKQRLLALAQFGGIAQDSRSNSFALEKLTVRTDLNGMSLDAIQSDPLFVDELNAFDNATVRTVVIKNWPSDDYLYVVFHRLNTGSVPLSPQELRQALFPGPFTAFVDAFSFDSLAIHSALGIQGSDFRMRDAELLTRTYGFATYLPEYSGNLKQFLDTTCARLNSDWATAEANIRAQAVQFEHGIRVCSEIFRDFTFRRSLGVSPERRFNRAVYDVQMFGMSEPRVRDVMSANPVEIRNAYIRLARTPAFNDATGSTTKSIGATYQRFSLWSSAVNAIVPGTLPTVTLGNDNRIRLN